MRSEHVDAILAAFAGLPPDEAEAFLRENVDATTAERLLYFWPLYARPEQLAPTGSWRWWLLLTGRRWGKTRTASEWVRERVEEGRARSIALIAQDPLAARSVMVGDVTGGAEAGPSSLIKIAPPDMRPVYHSSTKTLTWPNGARATVFSAEDPDQIRGGEFDTVWIDELAALKNLEAVIYNAEIALSARDAFGDQPRGVMSTTPRPLKAIKALKNSPDVKVTGGRLIDNVDNLSPEAVAKLRAKYEGTRIGRQELDGDLLEDVEGALWLPPWLDDLRVDAAPELLHCVVAVDPAASSGPLSSECGIVAAARGVDGHGYVLRDESAVLTPKGWGTRVVELYYDLGANEVVAEVNNGGEMVRQIILDVDARVPVRMVRASVGKRRRAEPIAALYENNPPLHVGRVHHVGSFPQLEDQMTTYTGATGDVSPDRMDALVWGLWATMLDDAVVDVV